MAQKELNQQELDFIKKFGQAIKERRAELGISQSDLATNTGLSKTTIQNYESGAYQNGSGIVVDISLSRITRVANGLNLTASKLIDKAEKLERADRKGIITNTNTFIVKYDKSETHFFA